MTRNPPGENGFFVASLLKNDNSPRSTQGYLSTAVKAVDSPGHIQEERE